jgi:hypothetical protein
MGIYGKVTETAGMGTPAIAMAIRREKHITKN